MQRDRPRRQNSGGRGRKQGRKPRNYHRQSYDSGNQRERIAVESGALVFIDQFMLANPRFFDQYSEIIDESSEVKDKLIKRYGGNVVEVEPGTYKIQRDPYASTIIIHQEGESKETFNFSEEGESVGEVQLDTRCLAMIDRELLDDSSLLEKYQQLWFSGQDKACRDLLRDNGGAVRYGFSRFSDDLVIKYSAEENVVALTK
jgi:hypothetical protein